MMNKPVKMVLVNSYSSTRPYFQKQPYLISNDKIEVGDIVCEFLTSGEYLPMTIHTKNDIDVNRQYKIIATPEEIGYVIRYKWDGNKSVPLNFIKDLKLISNNDIKDILKEGGKCYLQMDEYHGDYCGYRTISYKDKKVIINLKK